MNNSLKYCCLSLLIFSGLSLALEHPIKLTEPYQIASYGGNGLNSVYQAHRIPGARSCGGPGIFRQASFEHCTTGQKAFPCVIPRNATGLAEIVFIPSKNIKGLVIRQTITAAKEKSIYFEHRLAEENLKGGEEYTLRMAGGVAPQLLGKHFTCRVEFFREKTGQLEICLLVDFFAAVE